MNSVSNQGSAKTKEDAEKALQDTNKLDDEVDDMMNQLSAAEQELARKKAEADQDMMMAAMVRRWNATGNEIILFEKVWKNQTQLCFSVSQASDNAKEAEDNARKAKSAVKTILGTITALLDQLGKTLAVRKRVHCSRSRFIVNSPSFSPPGNIDKVDLSKLNQIEESLKSAKGKMTNSELDRKLAELNDVARTQEDMINDYDRQIREIRGDIDNLIDIKNMLPDGCFNTPSLERP